MRELLGRAEIFLIRKWYVASYLDDCFVSAGLSRYVEVVGQLSIGWHGWSFCFGWLYEQRRTGGFDVFGGVESNRVVLKRQTHYCT